MNIKFLSALFAAFLLVACAAPVRYVETSTPTTYTKVCDADGKCQFVAVVATTANVPAVVYVQPQPLYVSPVLGAVAGVIILHEIFGHRNYRRGR